VRARRTSCAARRARRENDGGVGQDGGNRGAFSLSEHPPRAVGIPVRETGEGPYTVHSVYGPSCPARRRAVPGRYAGRTVPEGTSAALSAVSAALSGRGDGRAVWWCAADGPPGPRRPAAAAGRRAGT